MKTIEKPKMTCLQLTMAVMLNMLGSSIILMLSLTMASVQRQHLIPR